MDIPKRLYRRAPGYMGLMVLVILPIIIAGCNQLAPPEKLQIEEATAPVAEEPANSIADGNFTPIQEQEAAANQSDGKLSKMEPLFENLRHIKGGPNAPVTIIEYSDFKCPFCARFATDTLYWIRKYYVETNKVRFGFKHVATLGPESQRAAEASECAAEQDQFWAFHDRVYADQAARGSFLTDKTLIDIAEKLGLDTTAFEACLNSGRHSDHVKQQSQEAHSIGVRATPGFIINGSLVIGAQPFEVFADLIEQELDKLGTQVEQQPVDEIEELTVFPAEGVPAEVLDGIWQNCGVYDEPVPLENVLSSLSHGAVWIAYRSDLPGSQIKILKDLVSQAQARRDEPMIILAPGPYSNTAIMLTAWRVQLALSDASDPRLPRFLDEFQVGPFTPEPGETCSNGVGEPVG